MPTAKIRLVVCAYLLATGAVFGQDAAPQVQVTNSSSATPGNTIEAVTTSATAVPPQPIRPVLSGDAEEGKLRVYTCTGCHGIPGYRNVYPTYHVPKIHGQNAQYVVTALTDYREGRRQHPTMQAQGESLSDQDIADIAAYLSTATRK